MEDCWQIHHNAITLSLSPKAIYSSRYSLTILSFHCRYQISISHSFSGANAVVEKTDIGVLVNFLQNIPIDDKCKTDPLYFTKVNTESKFTDVTRAVLSLISRLSKNSDFGSYTLIYKTSALINKRTKRLGVLPTICTRGKWT